MSDINEIVVLGGGSSGWLAASILAKTIGIHTPANLKVTLIESPDIGTIGVGEGSLPTLPGTLNYLGIDEQQFLMRCSATFKQAIKFSNWVKSPIEGGDDYYHFFDSPAVCDGVNLASHWLASDRSRSFDASVTPQYRFCEDGLAPRHSTEPSYSFRSRYGYHLDSSKFGELLCEHAVDNLGVKHISANVVDASLDDFGYIVSVTTEEYGIIEADFFVDCSGFSAFLVGKKLNVPFVDKSSELFVDTALATRIPYQDYNQKLPPYTIATAQSNGWIWDIGLTNRRGVGHVYSSKHQNECDALKGLGDYLNSSVDDIDYRKIKFRVGYREKLWVKNCVAIGFSSGFAEPLEATAIAMAEAASMSLATRFPSNRDECEVLAKSYNKVYTYRWETLFDFIKLHYYLSKRTDSQFWLDNRDITKLNPRLLEMLEVWRYQAPSEEDINSLSNMFRSENFHYVLYGMGFDTVSGVNLIGEANLDSDKVLTTFDKVVARMADGVPAHRDLLNNIIAKSI